MSSVTYIDGRGFRNEALEPRVSYGMNAADRQKLVKRHFEAGQLREAADSLNLVRAVELGAALQRLKGER